MINSIEILPNRPISLNLSTGLNIRVEDQSTLWGLPLNYAEKGPIINFFRNKQDVFENFDKNYLRVNVTKVMYYREFLVYLLKTLDY